jgi:hypothetical protein
MGRHSGKSTSAFGRSLADCVVKAGGPMIINLKGTNGSGKSTIVHQIIKSYGIVNMVTYPLIERKRKPMGYLCWHKDSIRRLFVPGHYEIQNGGVDTLPDLEYAYKLILEHHQLGADVLYEGKNLSDGMKNITLMQHVGLDVRVIFLDLPLAACIRAVRKRGHMIAEETITKLYLKNLRDLEISRRAIEHTYHLTREEAKAKIQEWLK